MSVTRQISVACLALVACARASETKQDPVKPDPVPVPVTPKTAADHVLLLEQHAYSAAQASYLAVNLVADPKATPTLDALGERPALVGVAPGYYRTAVAHRGRWWAYAIAGTKVVIHLTSAKVGGKPSYQIDVGLAATALYLAADDVLFVGSERAVGWVDLAAPRPTYVELVKRDGFAHKAYDHFVRDGDRLLAIDDEVMPMFADWFSLDASGRPVKRLGDWQLPGVINGHYDHAALLATAANAWTLFLVAPYSVLSGNGQALAAVPIRNDSLVFDKDLTLQNAGGKLPVAVEHVDDRGQSRPPVLLGGTKYSAWTGLAITSKQVVLAAGPRGLMTLPLDLSGKPRLVDLGGEVRDLRAHGALVYALVGSELVVLDGNLAVVARHALPAAFDRFVD